MVTDGKATARAVSFEPSLREAFLNSKDTGTAVQLMNCSIKSNKEEELEILANNQSKIHTSPKKFSLEQPSAAHTKQVELCNINHISVGQTVEVLCKVVTVSPPQDIKSKAGREVKLQNVTVADAKASTKLTLWEDQVGQLNEGATYRMTNLKVRQYNLLKSLSASIDSTFTEEDDIGAVKSDCSDDEEDSQRVVTGEIDTVINVDEYCTCTRCKSKAVAVDQIVAQCTKCGSMMKIARCPTGCTAKVILEGES